MSERTPDIISKINNIINETDTVDLPYLRHIRYDMFLMKKRRKIDYLEILNFLKTKYCSKFQVELEIKAFFVIQLFFNAT